MEAPTIPGRPATLFAWQQKGSACASTLFTQFVEYESLEFLVDVEPDGTRIAQQAPVNVPLPRLAFDTGYELASSWKERSVVRGDSAARQPVYLWKAPGSDSASACLAVTPALLDYCPPLCDPCHCRAVGFAALPGVHRAALA